jgi:hypothetical protein
MAAADPVPWARVQGTPDSVEPLSDTIAADTAVIAAAGSASRAREASLLTRQLRPGGLRSASGHCIGLASRDGNCYAVFLTSMLLLS